MISTDIKVTGAESLDSFRSQTSSFSKISVRILFTLVSSIFSAAFRFLEPLPTFFQSDLRVSKKRICSYCSCVRCIRWFFLYLWHPYRLRSMRSTCHRLACLLLPRKICQFNFRKIFSFMTQKLTISGEIWHVIISIYRPTINMCMFAFSIRDS